ncbi:Kelch domain-containing protein 10 [Thelohanellus kitauei]|uniref:Kelch domain-containing protein 10 n=1 Tax=Thelohanellus kitauei TaxID=669202 RepID=A0A0C2MD86_THEKT|nr:Kelch domain-containing protein 10 [Thelohanellus kitauei]
MSQTDECIRPENRAHHCITSVREFIIIYGGCETNTGAECNDLCIYNTISGCCKRYQTPREIKDTCLSASICCVGNLVYIFGGDCVDEDIYRQTNSLVSFNLTDATWNVVYSHNDEYDENTPPPMWGNALFYHNGSLYVLGGFNCRLNLDTLHKFCIKTSTWSMVPQNGLRPIFKHQIFGTVYKNKKISMFDFFTNTWTSRATNSKSQHYPDDRIYESFTFSDNVGFMSGGINPNFNVVFSDIWRINLETFEWFKLEYSLKTGVYCHRMSVIDDYYLNSFGGYRDIYIPNPLECFTIRPKSLYHLCLESIYKSSNLRHYADFLPPAMAEEFNLNCIDSYFHH